MAPPNPLVVKFKAREFYQEQRAVQTPLFPVTHQSGALKHKASHIEGKVRAANRAAAFRANEGFTDTRNFQKKPSNTSD